ncbi:uncharacterized protein TNCV_1914491 [Trichonephila clavipes]|nr:uncharacterized protein TNCV_1914491 [Trichonephila clavipes]
MDVCKCTVPTRHGGTLNSRRAVRLVEGEERWAASDYYQSVPPLYWGGTEPNRTVTCVVLKATANDRRHLSLCHDEFRGPRSGLCRSGGISNNNIKIVAFIHKKNSCAAEQFHSHTSLEAVHRKTRKTGSGRWKVTSVFVIDQHVLRMAVNDRTTSSRQLAARWSTATGVLMSASSIRRRLLHCGLRARVPLYRISFTDTFEQLKRCLAEGFDLFKSNCQSLKEKFRLKDEGWANRRIIRHMGRSDAVIRRCRQEWVDNDRFQRHDGSGRPRATADQEDRLLSDQLSQRLIHRYQRPDVRPAFEYPP